MYITLSEFSAAQTSDFYYYEPNNAKGSISTLKLLDSNRLQTTKLRY